MDINTMICSNKLIVTGGQQKKDVLSKKEGHYYKKGLVLRVCSVSSNAEVCYEYVTPLEVCSSEEPSILFKCCSIDANRLYLCTQTEVLILELPQFERVGYISLPSFNDVHHVCPSIGGNLLVANTGLDMVLEVNIRGQVLREWNTIDKPVWEHFPKHIDYRKIASTKPHRAHPNYIFQIDENVWVTRFIQRDAICLTRPAHRINIGIEGPHDGVLFDDYIYFTTVDGHIVIISKDNLVKEEVINLNEIDNDGYQPLGWCRGLMVLNESKVWIGFSRLRATKFRENLSWVKHGFKKSEFFRTLPTRIALYDIIKRTKIKEIELESSGLNAVFSIVAEPSI